MGTTGLSFLRTWPCQKSRHPIPHSICCLRISRSSSCLTERGDDGGVLQQLKTSKAYDCELDIAGIVIRADSMLVELFDGRLREPTSADDEMAGGAGGARRTRA